MGKKGWQPIEKCTKRNGYWVLLTNSVWYGKGTWCPGGYQGQGCWIDEEHHVLFGITHFMKVPRLPKQPKRDGGK